MPQCPVPGCGRTCKTELGVRNHISQLAQPGRCPLHAKYRANEKDAPASPAQLPDVSAPSDTADTTDHSVIIEDVPDVDPSQADSQQVTCPVCTRKFINQRALNSHKSTHAIEANNSRRYNLRSGQQQQQTGSPGEPSSNSDHSAELAADCDKFYRSFDLMANQSSQFEYDAFDSLYTEFSDFMFKSNCKLKGVKHPAVTRYRLRKKRKRLKNDDAKIGKVSNAQRKDSNRRDRGRDNFEYQLCQYNYQNRRKRVLRKVMSPNKTGRCSIPMADLYNHFKASMETPNDLLLDEYPICDTRENISVTEEEVESAIRAISLDSAAGPDRVLTRTVRELKVGRIIKRIIDIMLTTGRVPSRMSEGKMILIFKDGDMKDIGNWRPITIYSVIRRIIERVLDKHLREHLELNCNQRGFVKGMPGCHVNAALVNGCLLDAKRNKSDCTAVFLDISKAFDRIGHKHIEMCLKSQGVPSNLVCLIMSLLRSNSVRINLGNENSDPIKIKRSVPQGGPLSPILFNLAINFIYNEVCESQFANKHGYKLDEGLDALCLTGFADDQVATAKTTDGARRIVDLTRSLFQKIGLEVNPRKSSAIHIKAGKLRTGMLQLSDEVTIECIDHDQVIKYLGCTFNSELKFDLGVVDELTNALNNLITFPDLMSDQKLNLINQYILPMLIYPLQAAPLKKIPELVLRVMDRSIRNTVKKITGVPTSTANDFFYSPRKYRGLAMVRCEWEVLIQHFAIAKRMATVPDELLHSVFDCQAEMDYCKQKLGVEGGTARQLRLALREMAFSDWSVMKYQGVGVRHYKHFPKANRLVYDKSGLSGSEWTAFLKLCTGYANLAGVRGTTGHYSTLCRHCPNDRAEIETLPHVLGKCSYNDELRNMRHHSLKHKLANLLREKGFFCTVEAYCVDTDGSSRFVDILASEPGTNKAYIIDPTVRWGRNEDMDKEVQEEKAGIYEKCYEYIAREYANFANKEFEVIGIWVGARGEIGTGIINLFDRFGLDKKQLPEISESVVTASLGIIHHHIYGSHKKK